MVADALSHHPNPPGAAGHTAAATTTMENNPIDFPATLICTTICVQKYTSVYCLLLTNFISYACGDYRRLNLATTHNRYPLPSLFDLSNKLHSYKFFSCIDLVKGYHQIPMVAQDVAKTAIITPFGLFEYLFMPFSLHNATQTFQRFMDSLFKQLPFVFCYMDDLIIASHRLEEHHEHLWQIFTILQENSLQINPTKCVFAAAAVEFLGHRVDQHGVRPLQRHVQAISDFPPPQDVEQLHQFLGMVNFYRRFLPGIARTLQPLTDALRGDPKMLEWQPTVAFKAAKAALAAAVPLAHPTLNTVLSLATDASDTHVGGMLQQLARGSWQPRSTPRSCRGWAPDTPPSTGSCWPPSAQSDTSDSCWKGDVFTCSLTTSHWSHSCSAPRRRGRPASSDITPSSPNSHQTSDTHQAKRTWWLTP